MLKSYWGVFSFIFCAVFAVSLTASADVGSEVFVVSSSFNGDANYMSVTDEGAFSSQEILHLRSEMDCYGNGLGDFDSDGDLDYIMAIGFYTGNIYIHEKLNDGNQFADPYLVNTWGGGGEGGYYAMDMAVADYNEDGNADFVLSLAYSYSSGLYLGDGEFGFESTLLPETGAFSSSGADAADFNNDGHADFVIASSSDEELKVSLGDGNGKFAPSGFKVYDVDIDEFNIDDIDTYPIDPVYGVAAADFTGDGIADIAAAASDYLYVYKGDGDGVTFTYLDRYELMLNLSTIDNLDFDGDKIQDLVIADYGSEPTGIAVLLGNGDGTFEYGGTYLGGSELERNAVTAHPWEPVKNMEPVAVIEDANLEVAAGDEIVFDGSNSFDEDGQIVSYEWNFGDADPIAASAPSANGASISLMSMVAADPKFNGAKPSHIYNDTGIYTVTLSVTDDMGAKGTVVAEVHVKAASVSAIVKFHPRRLNLKSREKWITAFIKLPKKYDPRQIDLASVSVSAGKAELPAAQPKYGKHRFLAKIWRKILRRRQVVTVRFDRQELIRAIGSASDGIDLTVKGEISHNGSRVDFTGTDTIKAFKKSKKWYFFKKWKSNRK